MHGSGWRGFALHFQMSDWEGKRGYATTCSNVCMYTEHLITQVGIQPSDLHG